MQGYRATRVVSNQEGSSSEEDDVSTLSLAAKRALFKEKIHKLSGVDDPVVLPRSAVKVVGIVIDSEEDIQRINTSLPSTPLRTIIPTPMNSIIASTPVKGGNLIDNAPEVGSVAKKREFFKRKIGDETAALLSAVRATAAHGKATGQRNTEANEKVKNEEENLKMTTDNLNQAAETPGSKNEVADAIENEGGGKSDLIVNKMLDENTKEINQAKFEAALKRSAMRSASKKLTNHQEEMLQSHERIIMMEPSSPSPLKKKQKMETEGELSSSSSTAYRRHMLI